MQIYFHTPAGEKCPIEVPEDGTVVTLKAQIMMVAGSMLEEERLWTGSDPLFSIDHEKSAMDERPKSQSPVQPKKKSDRRDFIVRMGGVKLEDGYFLTHYKIQDGSVVHPEWESVDLAPTYSTAFLSAVDPDWWNEAHRQTIENIRYGWAHLRWPTFEDLRRIGPDLIWPGPLVVRRNKPDGGEEETRHRKPRKEEEEEEESQYSEEQEEEWEEERGRAPHVRDTQPPPPPPKQHSPPAPPPKQRAPPPPSRREMEEEEEEDWEGEERQAQQSRPANQFVF